VYRHIVSVRYQYRSVSFPSCGVFSRNRVSVAEGEGGVSVVEMLCCDCGDSDLSVDHVYQTALGGGLFCSIAGLFAGGNHGLWKGLLEAEGKSDIPKEGIVMERILLIINPCAGQKKIKKVLTEVIDAFNRADFEVITYVTAGSGDAREICVRYADRIDRVVCCGGDGTFNETVSGVLESKKDIPIGYIPAGSTNDFAASLKLSTNIQQAVEDIVWGEPKRLDIGQFGERYFSYVASFGAFTRASYTTPQNLKNLLGHTAYVLSGIQELSQIRSYPLSFQLSDGRCIEDSFIFGAISNSTSVGGILSLSSDVVDMADGMFELLLIRAPRDLFEVSECVRALQQKTYNCSMLTFVNTDRLTITAPKEMAWTLDGEMAEGREQIEVACLQHAIRVFRRKKE